MNAQVLERETVHTTELTAELATVDFPSYRASLHAAGGKGLPSLPIRSGWSGTLVESQTLLENAPSLLPLA